MRRRVWDACHAAPREAALYGLPPNGRVSRHAACGGELHLRRLRFEFAALGRARVSIHGLGVPRRRTRYKTISLCRFVARSGGQGTPLYRCNEETAWVLMKERSLVRFA